MLAVRVAGKIRATDWSCFRGRISTPSPKVLGCRAAAAAVQKARNAAANVNTPQRGKRRKRVKSPLTQCLPASQRASERRHTHDGQCVPRINKAEADMLVSATNRTKPPSQRPRAAGCSQSHIHVQNGAFGLGLGLFFLVEASLGAAAPSRATRLRSPLNLLLRFF